MYSFAQGVVFGLSICKSIVDKMNGRIQVNSQLGLGTTFIAELPCHSILVNEKKKIDVFRILFQKFFLKIHIIVIACLQILNLKMVSLHIIAQC